MEEIYPTLGEDVGNFLKNMKFKVEKEGDPVTALVNDVRVIMFVEKMFVDSQYDGPR